MGQSFHRLQHSGAGALWRGGLPGACLGAVPRRGRILAVLNVLWRAKGPSVGAVGSSMRKGKTPQTHGSIASPARHSALRSGKQPKILGSCKSRSKHTRHGQGPWNFDPLEAGSQWRGKELCQTNVNPRGEMVLLSSTTKGPDF